MARDHEEMRMFKVHQPDAQAGRRRGLKSVEFFL